MKPITLSGNTTLAHIRICRMILYIYVFDFLFKKVTKSKHANFITD